MFLSDPLASRASRLSDERAGGSRRGAKCVVGGRLMSVFSRVSDIVVANIHALLDRADSEALLAQVIREMEAGLAEARRAAAVAVAAERRLGRERDRHRAAADHWKGRAKEALAAGRVDLARRALAERIEHDTVAADLDAQQGDGASHGR